MSKTEKSMPIDIRISNMLEEARFLADVKNDIYAYDSVSRVAVELAESTFDQEVILNSHLLFLEKVPENIYIPQVSQSIGRVQSLLGRSYNAKQIFKARMIMSHAAYKCIYGKSELGELALDLAQKAKNYADKNNSARQKVQVRLLLGKILLRIDETVKAYEELTSINALILGLKDARVIDSLSYELNGALFDFYMNIHDWDEAGDYKNDQISFLKRSEEIDSNKLMWHQYELASMSQLSGRHVGNDERLEDLLSFAKRTGNTRMKDWSLALYRQHLIINNQFDQLKELYQTRYPEDLEVLRKQRPILYCMVMGLFCEHNDMIDSAFHYFTEAEELLKTNNEKHYASVQYRRLGQINERHGKKNKAREYYEKAYNLAVQASNEVFALEAVEKLEKLLIDIEDYKSAYNYTTVKHELKNSIINWEKQQAIMRLSFTAQDEIEQIKEQNKSEQKKALHARQNWLIGILLALAIIAMMMMTTMPVAEWVIEMMSFFTVLCLFEFVILTIDHELHYMTEGAPLPMFGAKVALLSVLFPLHHVIESSVIKYMKKRKRLKDPEDTASFTVKRTIRRGLATLWPWLAPREERKDDH